MKVDKRFKGDGRKSYAKHGSTVLVTDSNDNYCFYGVHGGEADGNRFCLPTAPRCRQSSRMTGEEEGVDGNVNNINGDYCCVKDAHRKHEHIQDAASQTDADV